MGVARKRQPTIYRLSDVPPPAKRGRPKLVDDHEIARLRVEIAREVLQEVFTDLIGTGQMTATELLSQLADRIKER